MSQTVSDLVINLGVDDATFAEQVPRITKLIGGMADEAEKSAKRQQNCLDNLARGYEGLCVTGEHTAETVSKSQEEMARSVEETHRQVTLMIEGEREAAAQATALKAQQDALTESLFRQVAAAKSLSGRTRRQKKRGSRLSSRKRRKRSLPVSRTLIPSLTRKPASWKSEIRNTGNLTP